MESGFPDLAAVGLSQMLDHEAASEGMSIMMQPQDVSAHYLPEICNRMLGLHPAAVDEGIIAKCCASSASSMQ